MSVAAMLIGGGGGGSYQENYLIRGFQNSPTNLSDKHIRFCDDFVDLCDTTVDHITSPHETRRSICGMFASAVDQTIKKYHEKPKITILFTKPNDDGSHLILVASGYPPPVDVA
jgi:hypothetical protein